MDWPVDHSFGREPWRTALQRTHCLPSGKVGPVLFSAYLWFASQRGEVEPEDLSGNLVVR
jgi:hypothetical protein